MSDEILLTIGEDGKATLYDDTYDITIHCESKEEHDEVMKELENIPHWIPHWIPVTERLPAMGKSVLMCDIGGDIYLGHRTQCGYYYPDFCGDRVKNVTAWCNLPEPYKGVTDGRD